MTRELKGPLRFVCRAVVASLWVAFLPIPSRSSSSLFIGPFIHLSPWLLAAVVS